MTNHRRMNDKLPEGELIFTDAVLIAAAQDHLRAERAGAFLLPVPDAEPQMYVAAGTKDALRGLLRDDPAGDTEVLAGLDWKAPVAASSEAAAPDEIDFLTDWLQFMAEPVGVECCGNGCGGGECCGNPVPVHYTLAEVEKAMNERLNKLISKSPTSLAGSGEKGGE